MKSIQFKLPDDKHEKAKKKLSEAGLSWQKVCEQLSDHIIMSESLDSYGIPIPVVEGTIQSRRSAMSGHAETALQKYIQIQLYTDEDDAPHWKSALLGALDQFIKDNKYREFKRGFVFYLPELRAIFQSQWKDAIKLAAGHLDLDESEIENKVTYPGMETVFQFAGKAIPSEWQEAKYNK